MTDPCLLVIFGASGDLTKRLLMPALLNLASDRLLPERFAVVGFGRAALTHDQFRERMTFALSKPDSLQVLNDHPDMAASIQEIAKSRYGMRNEG